MKNGARIIKKQEVSGRYIFLFFHEIGELSGKDRATGKDVETFDEAIDNMEKEIDNETNLISDEDNEDDDEISVTQPKPHSKLKRSRKQSMAKPKESQESTMVATFQNVSSNLNSFMENMNTHLGTMANAWSRAEEREQEMANKSNTVLEHLLQIEGLTSVEALQAADILTAEQNKLRVFYQAPLHLKRQYIMGLLYPPTGSSMPRMI
ncbi:uncharacterized protein [Euphorbia lathyris]|uniref:uncharacterized protein n=1 Tax=Euphorbia lathyris TaxID=212925 RepID=UPI003313B462